MNVAQATALFNLSRRTLYAWMEKGLLPYETRNGSRLFSKVDVGHLMETKGACHARH